MKVARTKERTAHGLWTVQRAFHVYSDLRADFDWFTAVKNVEPESYERFQLWFSGHRYRYRNYFSDICIVDKCAARYVRRWPHLIRKGAQYNRLVDRICDRMKAHHQTRKHALRFHFLLHRIVLHDRSYIWYRFCPLEVGKRKERMAKRKERMEKLKRELIFYELQETESELKHIRRAIRNAQSALRSATQ